MDDLSEDDRRRLEGAVVEAYEAEAATWDRARSRSLYERPWLDRFEALLVPGGEILDVGCGTGEPIAAHFVARGFAVVGVDAAEAMLRIARERVPAASFRRADMRTMELGRRFDGAVAWDSFFHLTQEDQATALAAFARHLRPGAPLLFTSGPTRSEAVGRVGAHRIYHASHAPEAYRTLLARAGFGIVGHVAEDPDCARRTVWLARRQGWIRSRARPSRSGR